MSDMQRFKALKIDPLKAAAMSKAAQGLPMSDQERRILDMSGDSDVKTGLAQLPQQISGQEMIDKRTKEQRDADAYNEYSASHPLQRVDPDSEKARMANAIMQKAMENQALANAEPQPAPQEEIDPLEQKIRDFNAQRIGAKGYFQRLKQPK